MRKKFSKGFVSIITVLVIFFECFSLVAFASSTNKIYTYTDSSGRFAEQVNVGVVAVGEMSSCKLAVTATAG